MKYIFVAMLILAIGCTQVSEIQILPEKELSFEKSYSEGKMSAETDVRLTDEGFDADGLSLDIGDSLTIHIIGDLNSHYLTMVGGRLAEKHLGSGELVNVVFDEHGTYEIIDEKSQNSLMVEVKK